MSDYAAPGEEKADAVVEATGERVVVPASWLDDEHLSRGLVRFTPAPVDVAPAPEVPEDPAPPAEPPAEPPQPPAKGAAKDDWIAWAVHRQVTEGGKAPHEAYDIAAAKTVSELVADYGDTATPIPADSPDEATLPHTKEK